MRLASPDPGNRSDPGTSPDLGTSPPVGLTLWPRSLQPAWWSPCPLAGPGPSHPMPGTQGPRSALEAGGQGANRLWAKQPPVEASCALQVVGPGRPMQAVNGLPSPGGPAELSAAGATGAWTRRQCWGPGRLALPRAHIWGGPADPAGGRGVGRRFCPPHPGSPCGVGLCTQPPPPNRTVLGSRAGLRGARAGFLPSVWFPWGQCVGP